MDRNQTIDLAAPIQHWTIFSFFRASGLLHQLRTSSSAALSSGNLLRIKPLRRSRPG
jgi:hypothetical protein